MVAPTVSVLTPPVSVTFPFPGGTYGIIRPEALVAWTGGTGPFDVLHEWDTDLGFGAPIQDLNTSVTSPNVGVPPSDLGPIGTTWYYRAKVTDTSDATSTTSPTSTLQWFDPQTQRRYLHALVDVGVGFDPQDVPGGGWGTGATVGPDGLNIVPRRYLHALVDVGVGFDPIDTPAGGWGPSSAGPGDGYAIDFRRFLHLLLGDVNTSTPTPHIWYVFPAYGREGWEFQIVGYGFGDTQATYTGTATLNGLAVSVISWALVAAVGSGMEINPVANLANPIHQLIRATVPTDGESGLVVVCTDGP